jgi:hypothetical protein
VFVIVANNLSMSLFTESRIQQLCSELAVNTPDDAKRVMSELKTALEQLLHLAKESLEVQVDPLYSYGQSKKPILKSSW